MLARRKPADKGSGAISLTLSEALATDAPRLMPRRLTVGLRILIPSIEVRILAGHPKVGQGVLPLDRPKAAASCAMSERIATAVAWSAWPASA